MKLRDYQEESVNALINAVLTKPCNPLAALPTGTGKSLVIAGFVQTALSVHPGTRFVMATHVKELVEQNYEKMLALMPNAPIGVYSAGLRRRDTALPIIYGSVASMVNRVAEFGHRDFLIVDEAHMVSPRDGTNYQKLIAGLKERNPRMMVVGLSATPFRLGQGHLTEGDDGIFNEVAIDLTGVQAYNRFVDEGYLSPIIPKRTRARIDVDGVGMVGGEFNGRQLREASDKEAITRAAIEESLEYGADRACWLTFASGVEHAEHIAEMQRSMGINAACVHSKMTTAERDERLRDFRAGKLRSMVGYKVLTTGFDHPPIDMVIDLYATASPGMHVQKYGRGGRPYYAPGFDLSTAEGRLSAIENSVKRNCLVLDFAKNVERLGPINDPRIPKRKGKGTGEVPVRICDVCGTYNHASARVCIGCGTEFTFKPKIYTEAGEEEIVRSSMPVLEYLDVTRVFYSKHVKKGGLPTLKVSYLSGLDRYNEWVALEHTGYARRNAAEWWRKRHASDPPDTVDEALERVSALAVPRRITVQTNLPYPKVISHEY